MHSNKSVLDKFQALIDQYIILEDHGQREPPLGKNFRFVCLSDFQKFGGNQEPCRLLIKKFKIQRVPVEFSSYCSLEHDSPIPLVEIEKASATRKA